MLDRFGFEAGINPPGRAAVSTRNGVFAGRMMSAWGLSSIGGNPGMNIFPVPLML